jgi:hypothetical protein
MYAAVARSKRGGREPFLLACCASVGLMHKLWEQKTKLAQALGTEKQNLVAGGIAQAPARTTCLNLPGSQFVFVKVQTSSKEAVYYEPASCEDCCTASLWAPLEPRPLAVGASAVSGVQPLRLHGSAHLSTQVSVPKEERDDGWEDGARGSGLNCMNWLVPDCS